VCKICSSQNDKTETRMDCIISGPSSHGRGCELRKVTGDQSWCYVDDTVTKRWHGVGGGKNSPQPKSCSSKNFLCGWCLSPIQAPRFRLLCNSESVCLMKHYQHPVFPVRSLPNMVIPSTVVALPNSIV
jgi:hypothetical protein